ncbi:1,2-phenylacetyl-CoA epoxidase subunit PaaC [Mechercharimyces sp. CAU 1602]|uniref:1,2-phenylacetyl-CoA epoxidase subunit PaaC n=1 Tax=Mechercharimyces sp. CAU 1602 TaxID=2973933 RepID=UPI002163C635|nr:1,2-phenylacetyl-CoA epoxidase subunit PaaC [Mechercharimyces sp. CAU 1602]MCS1351727.1 phenylacetate-CoA oxygenase subunit PaaC [Mechercharimyces sp. CAU 1602]
MIDEQRSEHPVYRSAVRDLLYQLADDELCIGHRASEWLGKAPDLEGDVAFASISQDEVGHALCYYELLHEWGEPEPDALAFMRTPNAWRNAVLVERDNGDWAHTIVRHFFYDMFDDIRLEALERSSYAPLAQAVEKIRREEHYHLLHFTLWFTRLLQAGGEARQRMERAISDIWPDVSGLFSLGEKEEQLCDWGIMPLSSVHIQEKWEMKMRALFAEVQLPWPGELPQQAIAGRVGQHTPALTSLLATMTEVLRVDATALW